MKRRLGFERIGLPKGHAYPQLAYHSPTGLVIAHTQPVNSPLPRRRLSLKRVNGMSYRPIADFPPSVSVESFLLHPQLPFLYFITYVWSKPVNGPVGGDWDALYRYSLNSRKCKIAARRGELVLPDGYRQAWLCELLSTTTDGKTLFCKAGLHNGKLVDYCLCQLSIAGREISVIAKLKTPFA